MAVLIRFNRFNLNHQCHQMRPKSAPVLKDMFKRKVKKNPHATDEEKNRAVEKEDQLKALHNHLQNSQQPRTFAKLHKKFKISQPAITEQELITRLKSHQKRTLSSSANLGNASEQKLLDAFFFNSVPQQNKLTLKLIKLIRESKQDHARKSKRFLESYSPLCSSCHPLAQPEQDPAPVQQYETSLHIFKSCPHTAVHITNLINKIDLYVTSTSNGAHQFESLWKQDPQNPSPNRSTLAYWLLCGYIPGNLLNVVRSNPKKFKSEDALLHFILSLAKTTVLAILHTKKIADLQRFALQYPQA